MGERFRTYGRMTHGQDGLEPIEEAMLELRDAEAAGVFGRTPVDVGAVLLRDGARATARFRMGRWRAVGMPLAACVVLAVGVAGGVFKSQLGHRGVGAGAGGGMVPGASGVDFATCLHGPGVSVAGACRAHDYDADGDVDLLDFRSYQTVFPAPNE